MPGSDIASLRHRFAIEAPVETPDGAGGVERAWTVVATVWAALPVFASRAGTERDRADRPELAMRTTVRMRWRSGLDGTIRLREGTRIFSILSVSDPDGRRRWLDVGVEEITP